MKNGVKNIQAMAYNGKRTVVVCHYFCLYMWNFSGNWVWIWYSQTALCLNQDMLLSATLLNVEMWIPLKPLQNKKGQKNLGYPTKKQSFYKEKRLLFCRVPQIFLALLILKRLYKFAQTLIRKTGFQFQLYYCLLSIT